MMTLLAVVRVLWHEQQLELLLLAGHLGLGLVHLGLCQLPLVSGGVVEHLPGGIEVRFGGLQPVPAVHDLLQLAMAPGDVAQTVRVGRESRVVELFQHRLVLALELVQAVLNPLVEHGQRVAPTPAGPSGLTPGGPSASGDQDAGGDVDRRRDPLLAYRRWNRSTRPPESTSFCLPVKNG